MCKGRGTPRTPFLRESRLRTTSAMPPAISGAMTRTMVPEDQLCLLLARGHLTPELRSRSLDLLATSLRWPLVLERAYSHQVYRCCIATCAIWVFPACRIRLSVTAGAFRSCSNCIVGASLGPKIFDGVLVPG